MIPIFVYGTLRQGFTDYENVLEGNIEKLFNAELNGYDLLDATPGIVKGDGIIKGQVLFVEPKKYLSVLKELDKLEGYNPSQKSKSTFHREIQKVMLDENKIIDAYVYVYNIKNGLNKKLQ